MADQPQRLGVLRPDRFWHWDHRRFNGSVNALAAQVEMGYVGSPSWRRISCWTSRRSCSNNGPIGRAPRPIRPRLEIVGYLRPVAVLCLRACRRQACSCRKWAGPRVFLPQCGQMCTLNAGRLLGFAFGMSPPANDGPLYRSAAKLQACRPCAPFASRGPGPTERSGSARTGLSPVRSHALPSLLARSPGGGASYGGDPVLAMM